MRRPTPSGSLESRYSPDPLIRLPPVLLGLLLSACATYTADYRERLVQSLPDRNGVTFKDTATYPGRVLCGKYTAYNWNSYGRETRAFIVTPDLTLNKPGRDEQAVYCSDDPQGALFDLFGIGGADSDRAELEKVRDDMAAIASAVLAFYNERGHAPRRLAQLLDGEFGVSGEQLVDPWARAYQFSGGLAGRSLPRFDLYTLGRDGSEGGTGPDADLHNTNIAMVRHVLRITQS